MIGPGDHPNKAWSALTPGTVLDAVLETFDPAALADSDLVEAVAACERQASHLHALQARMLAEIVSRTSRDECADAVGPAMTLEPGHVAERVTLAVELAGPLSATMTALDAGQVTLEKAGIIAERTRHLAVATRTAVETVAVERAPTLTPAQLQRWLDDALGGGCTSNCATS